MPGQGRGWIHTSDDKPYPPSNPEKLNSDRGWTKEAGLTRTPPAPASDQDHGARRPDPVLSKTNLNVGNDFY